MVTVIKEKFDPEIYDKIGYDELTNYAIYSLLKKIKKLPLKIS